jgi:hypothetical protein
MQRTAQRRRQSIKALIAKMDTAMAVTAIEEAFM